MSKILYIHQYFATPFGTTGTRSYEFSRRWVKAGHNVVVLTTVAQLSEQDMKNSKGRFVKQIMIDDIDVRAINLPYNQKMSFIKRSLSFVGFVLFASIYVLFIRKPDVIYATSTPLTIGIPAVIAKRSRRIPFVFEVRDQWPEIPIEMGIIKNKIMISILLGLECLIYKNASAIVALSPGMADGVRKVLKSSQCPIITVPNSSDTDAFRPDIDGSAIRKKFDWDDKIVFLHCGAMGQANGLDFLVYAAEKLRNSPNIHFVLMGQGRQKAELTKKIEKLCLKNIEILPPKSKAEMPCFLAACDISIVIFANYPILEHNSANKFFDSLSAGKPVLLNYSGWQREFIEEAKAGFGCQLCNLYEFVEKVQYLNLHREVLPEMGRNARKLAEEQFNRTKLAYQVLQVIVSACKGE